MWALECQKVSRPSSVSNVNNLSSQSPSNGLFMSHKTPFTIEIKALAAKLFDISFAISMGEVSHFLPSFTDPLGKVILSQKKKKKNRESYQYKTKATRKIKQRKQEKTKYFMGSWGRDWMSACCSDWIDWKRLMRLGMTLFRYPSSFAWFGDAIAEKWRRYEKGLARWEWESWDAKGDKKRRHFSVNVAEILAHCIC